METWRRYSILIQLPLFLSGLGLTAVARLAPAGHIGHRWAVLGAGVLFLSLSSIVALTSAPHHPADEDEVYLEGDT
jgi:hypothetical protein